MKTSLIILFKNEIEYVKLTMESTHSYLSNKEIDFELIAVDDSTDGTWEFLQSFANLHPNVIVVKGEEPSGYGKALLKGFSVATGDIFIPFNGDLSDSLDDVYSYINLIENGYDMVFGSRYMNGAKVTNSIAIKEKISQLGNKFLQILFITNCSDITNSFKAYKKTVIEDINPIVNGYHIGLEIALKGITMKYRYTTIPVTWTGREFGYSKMSMLKVIPRYLFTALQIKFFYSSSHRIR